MRHMAASDETFGRFTAGLGSSIVKIFGILLELGKNSNLFSHSDPHFRGNAWRFEDCVHFT